MLLKLRGAFLYAGLIMEASSITSPCVADRDIVYAARYYFPPGSKMRSYFHIYRINADGSGRTQVTSGRQDDIAPRWSPDGSKILFLRGAGETMSSVCVVGASGGQVRTLFSTKNGGYAWGPAWSPDGRRVAFSISMSPDYNSYVWLLESKTFRSRKICRGWASAWSPDGKRLYIIENDERGKILDLRTGRIVVLKGRTGGGLWLNNRALVVYSADEPGDKPVLRILHPDGTLRRWILVAMSPDDYDYTGFGAFPDALYSVPGDSSNLIYGLCNYNSTNGRSEIFYRVNLKTGKVKRLTDGQYLAWSPDGDQFCTGSCRDLADYGRRKFVWVSTLSVFSMGTGDKKPIVSGLVWVDGLDWRNTK